MTRRGKTALIWLVLVGIVVIALLNQASKPTPMPITGDIAMRMIDEGHVRSYRQTSGRLLLNATDGSTFDVPPPFGPVISKIVAAGVSYDAGDDSSPFTTIVLTLVVVGAGLFALAYFLRKRQGTAFNSIFDLRKSKARAVAEADKAKFTDIGGNRAAVELVADIVDYLRSPQRWTEAGLRVPRGVLVVGPPGTGKTLLARAVAGETNAAYFYASAAEFVELFVGVGAARVRDTFEKAVAKQPAVIFLDEIDAIGRRRGSGVGTMHEEREQTLNQLLVLLDGMEKHARLVVIAATNRPDVLDPALLRSGRFDRTLRLELPTAAERLEILKIHTRGKSLDPALSLDCIVASTPDFSGADLEALTNSAGLLALRRSRAASNGNHQAICLTDDDFDRAVQEMIKSNRQFDRLDSVLVESASQFAEPVGRAMARVTLVTGTVLEGRVLWMNATHMKLRCDDDTEVIIDKKNAAQISAVQGTEAVPQGDFIPDRIAGREVQAQ